jgi:5-(carboxyamino)imidazole ribonucleotide synthase
VIRPDSVLGVLGGGQLGAMFIGAATRLGFRVAVWDPDPDAPAHRLAHRSVTGPFEDATTLRAFRDEVSAVTYEWENIPATVVQALETSRPVRPGSEILRLLQNRLAQKTFLKDHRFPVTAFKTVAQPQHVQEASREIGYPCLCKTATAGYDGKGQWRLANDNDAIAAAEEIVRTARPKGQWIVEQFLAFEKELSVLVVRGEDGEQRVYPAVENVHEAGILRTTRAPADIEQSVASEAEALAAAAITVLEGVGVFCIELFLMPDQRLLINEIAPRPHNSGHYTLDVCTVSQFEQQVRALCGLPLGEVRLVSPAVMVNLIGEDLTRATSVGGLATLLKNPGAALHVYNKRSIRPGRKMGHVTFSADKAEEAWERAARLRRMLGD